MAKISMSSSEPVLIAEVVQQMFPGTSLKPVTDFFSRFSVTTDTVITDKLGADTTFTLEVIITK